MRYIFVRHWSILPVWKAGFAVLAFLKFKWRLLRFCSSARSDWQLSWRHVSEWRHVYHSRRQLSLRLCSRLHRNLLWITWVLFNLSVAVTGLSRPKCLSNQLCLIGWSGLFDGDTVILCLDVSETLKRTSLFLLVGITDGKCEDVVCDILGCIV